jgi:hypothetical protein
VVSLLALPATASKRRIILRNLTILGAGPIERSDILLPLDPATTPPYSLEDA